MSKKSKKQRANARKAQVRRESGIVLRAVRPPASAGAKVLELKPKAPADASLEPAPRHAIAPGEVGTGEAASSDASSPSAAPPNPGEPAHEVEAQGAVPSEAGLPKTAERGGDGAEARALVTDGVGAPNTEQRGAGAREAPEEHRASPRIALTVDIHLSSESHFFSGLSGDISEGGLFVSTYRSLNVGTQVDVEFSLPGIDRLVHARGEVRWIREHSAEQSRGVGIAFEELSEEDREQIHAFCSSRPPLYYEDVG